MSSAQPQPTQPDSLPPLVPNALPDLPYPTASLGRHLQTFEAICQTVAYAHKQGVIHRDLKPANVMVGAFGEVQVMDWGLAKEMGRGGDGTPMLPPGEAGSTVGSASARETIAGNDRPGTVPGNTIGTPAYMPPEQANGELHRVDARADVFALGAILCEILTGRPPYSGRFALLAARACDLEDVRPLLETCEADAELIALVRRCLAADPAERPADGSAVADAMAAYHRGVEQRLRAAEQERAAAEARAQEERKRRRVQRVLLGVVLLLVCGGGGFAWYVDRQTREQTFQDGFAREALDAALNQAETSLRPDRDRPEEAAIALAEARRRLKADAHADPQGELAARLAELDLQLALKAGLDGILDRSETLTKKGFDFAVIGRDTPGVFRDHGLDLEQPALVERRVRDWAIRDQVVGALDLWLDAEPTQRHLPALLAALDADPDRNAWRAAVASGNKKQQEQLADRLATAENPPRFIAAYRIAWPREMRLALLRAAWERYPKSSQLAFSLASSLDENPAKRDEAIGFYRVCLGVNPEHTAALNNLGVALQDKKELDGAIKSYRRAIAIDPSNAKAHYNLGNALSDKKDLDGAIESFRNAIQRKPDYAQALCGLGLGLREQGSFAEAILALQRGHDLGSQQPGWDLPSDRWLREAQRWRDLDLRLPRLLEGAEDLASPEETDEFAILCWRYRQRFAEATRLYADLFRDHPDLVSLRQGSDAACAAVRAANGEGVDPSPPANRPALRQQALGWLGTDLNIRRKTHPTTLRGWLETADLASVREPAALAKLPEDERMAWQQFWDEVRRTLDEVQRPQNERDRDLLRGRGWLGC